MQKCLFTYQQIRQFSTKASNRLTENITIHIQKYNLPIVRSTKIIEPTLYDFVTF